MYFYTIYYITLFYTIATKHPYIDSTTVLSDINNYILY